MKANLRIFAALVCAGVLVGSGFAQGPGGGRRQGGRNAQPSLSNLLQRADVQAELKITDDEKTKIEALRPQRGAGGPGGGGGAGAPAGGPPSAAAMEERRATQRKAVQDILTAEQFTRLEQLLIQRESVRAITRKEVQDQVGLTDDQKSKVKTLMEKYTAANTEIRDKVRNQEMDRQAAREAQATNAKVLTDELGKVLTTDQSTKLTALGGAPFTFVDAPAGGGR